MKPIMVVVQCCIEFGPTCGSGILEVGEPAMKDFRYIMTGTLDCPGELPPKEEFFCSRREKWMPEVHYTTMGNDGMGTK